MSDSYPLIDVAVGVVYDPEGRVLVNRRPKGKTFAGRWEFPGGKIKPGETVAQAVSRELGEELGIRAGPQRRLISFTHEYDALRVRLHVNEVLAHQGVPENREGQPIQWVETDRLAGIDFLEANSTIVKAILLPRVCLITDTRRFGIELTLELLGQHVERQRILVVVREKKMERKRLSSFVGSVSAICQSAGSLVCVHADCSFDEYEKVDGIHFSARAPASSGVPGQGRLLGVSCHSREEMEAACKHGASYVFLSPVKQTDSHPDAVPLGWERFAELCAPAAIPVFALGGMKPADFETALREGAHGIAMLGAAWKS